MTQIRDDKSGPYKLIARRRSADGQELHLHRHGEGAEAVEHEHAIGLGAHRHLEGYHLVRKYEANRL